MSMPNQPLINDTNWSQEIVGQDIEQQKGLVRWWYERTTPPPPANNASFVQREAYRKARLISTVAFYLIAILVFFIPATLYMPISTLYLDIVIILITAGALIANKAGKTLISGLTIVLTFEIALALGIIMITPLDPTGLQLYDLFIIGILLAVSLLPIRTVFLFALGNSIFTVIDILFHAKSAGLTAALNTDQFIPALVRPIGLQFMVAGVAYLWVHSASKAIERANRAEMVAMLEHVVAEQRSSIEAEKQELEQSIQQLVQAHVDLTNGQLSSRIQYPPAKVLWPLVGVLNALWSRLQRSHQTEYELGRIKQGIHQSAQIIQEASHSNQKPTLPKTGTELDTLLLSIHSYNNSSRKTTP